MNFDFKQLLFDFFPRDFDFLKSNSAAVRASVVARRMGSGALFPLATTETWQASVVASSIRSGAPIVLATTCTWLQSG